MGGMLPAQPVVPLCLVSLSPGTDEQPVVEGRYAVVADKPSSARVAVQMKEVQRTQLGNLKLEPQTLDQV